MSRRQHRGTSCRGGRGGGGGGWGGGGATHLWHQHTHCPQHGPPGMQQLSLIVPAAQQQLDTLALMCLASRGCSSTLAGLAVTSVQRPCWEALLVFRAGLRLWRIRG